MDTSFNLWRNHITKNAGLQEVNDHALPEGRLYGAVLVYRPLQDPGGL